jgi:hypothetical protein
MLYATLYNQDIANVQRSGKAARSNCRFNADANTGHGFAIFMASIGALRLRLRRRLTLALALHPPHGAASAG